MSRLRIRAEDERRAYEALHAHIRCQEEAGSTPAGRKADDLRARGHKHSNDGDYEDAHALYREALALFSPEDRGAAAAAALYDLGESYARQRGGSKEENLREAERLFRRSLESPARRRDPIRLALTHDALGRVLRRRAHRLPTAEAKRLELEGIKEIARACQIMESIGSAGWLPAAEYYTNLGNALAQAERLDEAAEAHERSLRYVRGVEDNLEHPTIKHLLGTRKQSRLAVPLMNLASVLSSRGKLGDLERAVSLCGEAEKAGTTEEAMQARLAIAGALHRLGDDERAVQVAKSVELHRLAADLQVGLVELFLALGHPAQAVAVARKGGKEAMAARQQALADHLADHAASRAQRFGVLAARAWVDQGNAVAAFLELENVCGLRYYDQVSGYARAMPTDPVVRAISEVLGAHSFAAKTLDELASRAAYLPESEQRAFLGLHGALATPVISAAAASAESPRQLHVVQSHADDIAHAASHPSPVTALRTAAQKHLQRRVDLGRAVDARGTPLGQKEAWDQGMTPEALATVVADEPGRVAVRVHLSDRLLVAAVWLEGGELRGRSFHREVPVGLAHRLLAEAVDADEGDDEAGAESALNWTEALAELDLAGVLPEDVRHLVILPSLLAGLVPWAAVGAAAPLVSRVTAITVLPGLMPLWSRHAHCPPRSGLLTIAPADHAGQCATRFHGAALSVEFPNETRLLGEHATIDAAERAARQADVVTFYAHGNGGQVEEPGILLVDGTFEPDPQSGTWYGVERVELWACRSGINLPDDPLIPFVDDAFGVDIDFHRAGARSTIGTLWSVPDFVTGCIVARFRRALEQGKLAPEALADAQRWWLAEAVPSLILRLQQSGEEDAVQGFLGELGIVASAGQGIGGVLGPLPADGRLPAEEIDALAARLTSPLAWAGYRFVGACERRPLGGPPPVPAPLTDEENAEVDRILSEPSPAGMTIDEWQADALRRATDDVADRSPTPDEAVQAARLYADRRQSSPRHNLLRGLAWLHEVLADPGLAAEDRVRLRLEAAWLWLEAARCDTGDERLIGLFPTDHVAVARAAALIDGLPRDCDTVVLQAWVAVYDSDRRESHEVAAERWGTVRSSGGDFSGDGYAALRRNRAILELALCCREVPNEAGELASIDVNGLIEDSGGARFAAHRWDLARTAVLRRLGRDGGDAYDMQYLPHRDIGRAIGLRLEGRDDTDPDWSHYIEELNDGLCLVEYHYWGDPSDTRGTFWGTTGTPSRAWAFAGGQFLSQQLRIPQTAGRVPHYLSCLQLSADLRIAPLNAWSKGFAHVGRESFGRLGNEVWAVEHMLMFLSDAAAQRAQPDHRGSLTPPTPEFDPFTKSSAELAAAAETSPLAGTSWKLANCTMDWFKVEVQGRTAAFQVEQLVSRIQQSVTAHWDLIRKGLDGEFGEEMSAQGLSEGADAIRDLLDADGELRAVEEQLRDLPEWCAVLGLSVGSRGEIVALSLWREGKELHERSHVTEPWVGFVLAAHLAEVLQRASDDFRPTHGRAGTRPAAWAAVVKLMDPILVKVLAPALTVNRHLRVFAPGALRSLPALTLTAGGRPLAVGFGSVSLLPSIGFDRRVSIQPVREPFTVCTLAPEHEDGETCFGEAAIRTLRRWYPPEVVAEAVNPTGRDIVEVNAIEAVEDRANVVRFYGVGHPWTLNASTVGLRLPGGRSYSLANTRGMALPKASAVEMWAAVGGGSEMASTVAYTGDALPAFVRSFLMNGAAGVLDLAWPAHDLVKAMVAECFGATRRLGPLWEPVALARAVGWVGMVLELWKEASKGFKTTEEALRWLDETRMGAAHQAKLDPRAVVPFEPLVSAPSLPRTVEELVTEICQPVHLAAFRWWGA